MIYDGFIFNDEIDLLLLRFDYLSPVVDKFVVIEAEFSLAGNRKPLHFQLNKELFSRFSDKIIYASIPYSYCNHEDAWQNEFFQRNFIKTQLSGLADDDIVHVGDVDEMPNLYDILKKYTIDKPYLVELPIFNSFLNLRGRGQYRVNLLAPYSFIKDLDIGNRENFKYVVSDHIDMKDMKTGWHFSYLFGLNVAQHQNKLKSFSHQEFNTPYFVDGERIRTLLSLRADVLERNTVFRMVDMAKEFTPELNNSIKNTGLDKKYIYKKPGLAFFLNFYHLKYFMKFSAKPRLKLTLRKWGLIK